MVSSRSKAVTVSEEAYRVLGSGCPRALKDFFSDCLAYNLVGNEEGAELRFRQTINELIRGRLLQVTLERVADEGPNDVTFAMRPDAIAAMY